MLSMVYVSSATRPLTDDDFKQILAAAQRNNERHGITGLLLYKDGNFMQALEGPDEAVIAAYDHICLDKRHRGLLVLLREEIAERRFPEWSMSLKRIDRLQIPASASLSSFIDDSFTAESFQKNPTTAVKLLLSFRDSMR
jgi:Sensors of blue-light using FAD